MLEERQAFYEKCYDVFSVDAVGVIPPDGQLSPHSKIPLLARGKSPGRLGRSGWSGYGWLHHEPTRAEVIQWARDGANLGLKAARWPGLDIDSSDADIAQRIQELALGTLGPAPVRGRSNSAKRLLQYRTAEPFSKMRLWIEKADASKHLIEILGNKNQYLVSGVHTSGVEYEWDRDPTTQPATEITREQVSQFLDAVAAEFEALGYKTHREGTGQVSAPAGEQADLLAPGVGAARIEAIRDCVSHIPNSDEVYPDRGDCVKVGCAVKAAFGSEHEDEARECFYDWLDRWDGGSNSPAFGEAIWRSIHSPYRVGWSWLVGQAQGFGFNAAQYEFETVDGTTPPAPDVRAEEDAEAAQWAATASEEERLAAIIGSADRPFFAAVGRLSGDAVSDMWERLTSAASQCDPLTSVFRSDVLVPALRLRHFAAERSVFDVALGAQVKDVLNARNADEVRLLRRAAWLLSAPVEMLVGQATASPGSIWRAGDQKTVKREWLIDGALPRRGVGALVGPPGNGKSWIVSDFACRVALGNPSGFAGHPVANAGAVVCFATEDVDGFRERVDRQLREFGVAEADVFVFDGAPPLSSLADAIPCVRDVLAQLRARGTPPPVAIIVDVVKGATTGDENSAQEMGTVMATLHALARMANAFVLIAHHSAIADSGRARGSSVIEGALDWEATVSKKDETITLRVKKNKGGKSDGEFRWHLIDPGVLKEGMAPVITDDATIGTQCANIAGVAIRAIATTTHGVTKAELFAEMRAERPDLFLREGRVDRSRQSRALSTALNEGWVDQHRGEYRVGRVEPESFDLSAIPDSLSDLL